MFPCAPIEAGWRINQRNKLMGGMLLQQMITECWGGEQRGAREVSRERGK